MKIGILALQGDFLKHEHLLLNLGWDCVRVRYKKDFSSIDGLIIPGGESTTLTKLLKATGLFVPLKEFAKTHPILGTCAGLILMSRESSDKKVSTLGLLDIKIERNAFGRQVHSFTANMDLIKNESTIQGTFIRAPKISKFGENVEVLAKLDGEPVAVRQGIHIGLGFHPELNNEPIFHRLAFSTPVKKTNHSNFVMSHVA
ncbi:MAG: pyridoxal 5'-phosphate synthase glutaminase subunit PdxT [Candidatus Marinimicrobia bacterium]|jgi:5'-phosphate synthase pdxT subunit|nr:pyridoxal 5'-phosphate synthase glutaminase subunit PdxT [Candidatus Neomarinimicrobiota bacterium]|tara:strand:+ start:755 stop:1357 length:603 start_codon:yes stop_codon:yes gene_type:complete